MMGEGRRRSDVMWDLQSSKRRGGGEVEVAGRRHLDDTTIYPLLITSRVLPTRRDTTSVRSAHCAFVTSKSISPSKHANDIEILT